MSESRTAIVTGGTRGIGRVIALALAGAGYSVVACGRTAVDLGAPAGADVKVVPCDVTDPQALRALVEHVRLTRGGIDALVCTAGAVLRKSIDDVSPEELEALFRVNVFGCYNTISTAVPAMRN